MHKGSRRDLATISGILREMMGKYKWGDAVTSIEDVKKIVDAFGVSLDYLVGEGQNASFDKATLKDFKMRRRCPICKITTFCRI